MAARVLFSNLFMEWCVRSRKLQESRVTNPREPCHWKLILPLPLVKPLISQISPLCGVHILPLRDRNIKMMDMVQDLWMENQTPLAATRNRQPPVDSIHQPSLTATGNATIPNNQGRPTPWAENCQITGSSDSLSQQASATMITYGLFTKQGGSTRIG